MMKFVIKILIYYLVVIYNTNAIEKVSFDDNAQFLNIKKQTRDKIQKTKLKDITDTYEILYAEYPVECGLLGDKRHINGVKIWNADNKKIRFCNYINFDTLWMTQFLGHYSTPLLPNLSLFKLAINNLLNLSYKEYKLQNFLFDNIIKEKEWLDEISKIANHTWNSRNNAHHNRELFLVFPHNQIYDIECMPYYFFKEVAPMMDWKYESLLAPIVLKFENTNNLFRCIYNNGVFNQFNKQQQLWISFRFRHPEYCGLRCANKILNYNKLKNTPNNLSTYFLWEILLPNHSNISSWKLVGNYPDEDNFENNKFVAIDIHGGNIDYAVSHLEMNKFIKLIYIIKNNPPPIPKLFSEYCKKNKVPILSAKDFWLMVIKTELIHRGRTFIMTQESRPFFRREKGPVHFTDSLEIAKWMKNVLKIYNPYYIRLHKATKEICVKKNNIQYFIYSENDKNWGIPMYFDQNFKELYNIICERIFEVSTDYWRIIDSNWQE